jgi:hypothetical protein
MPLPKADEDAGGSVSNIPSTARQDVSSSTSDKGLVKPADHTAGPRQVGAFQQRVVEMDGVGVGIIGDDVVTGARMRSACAQDAFSDLAWQPAIRSVLHSGSTGATGEAWAAHAHPKTRSRVNQVTIRIMTYLSGEHRLARL